MEESLYVRLKDDFCNNIKAARDISQVSKQIDSIPEVYKLPLLSAIEWHCLGNERRSVGMSFQCHWIAIEKQALWWCNRLNLLKSTDKIMDDFARTKGVTINKKEISIRIKGNNWEALFERVHELSDKTDASKKEMVTKAVMNVYGNKKEAKQDLLDLFDGKQSLKTLRDTINQGAIDKRSIEKRLSNAVAEKMRSICQRFLLYSIEKLAMEGMDDDW